MTKNTTSPPVPIGFSTYLAVAYAALALVGVIFLIARGESEASVGLAVSSAGVLYKLIDSRGRQAETLSVISTDPDRSSLFGTALESGKAGESVSVDLDGKRIAAAIRQMSEDTAITKGFSEKLAEAYPPAPARVSGEVADPDDYEEGVDALEDESLNQEIAILGANAPGYDELPDDIGDSQVEKEEN